MEEEVLVKRMFAARRDPKQVSTPQNDRAQATLAGQFLTTCFPPWIHNARPAFTTTISQAPNESPNAHAHAHATSLA